MEHLFKSNLEYQIFSIAVVCVSQLFYRNGKDVIVKDGVALPYLVTRGMSSNLRPLCETVIQSCLAKKHESYRKVFFKSHPGIGIRY